MYGVDERTKVYTSCEVVGCLYACTRWRGLGHYNDYPVSEPVSTFLRTRAPTIGSFDVVCGSVEEPPVCRSSVSVYKYPYPVPTGTV